MASEQISRRGALFVGLLVVVAGVPPILIGLGAIPSARLEAGTPGWLGVAAGLTFVAAGLVVVLEYGIAGGMGSDGDFRPGTPFAIRAAAFVLGMTIVASMIAVSGWIAFGPGARRFASAAALPFVMVRWVSGETSGRVFFGFGTILLIVMLVYGTASGIERLGRAWKE